jgi:hypothetical protein
LVVAVLAASAIIAVVVLRLCRQYDPELITISQNDPRVKAEQRQLEGTWSDSGGIELVLKSDKWRGWFPLTGKPDRFRIDPSKPTKQIDLIRSDGYMIMGVYELHGDTLKLAFHFYPQRPLTMLVSTGSDIRDWNGGFVVKTFTRNVPQERAGN